MHLIDFCQKNCNPMRMAHALADHVFFISTNQMQPRCQSCVEFNGGFRGWPLFLLILNPLQAVAKSKCGKLPFSMIKLPPHGKGTCQNTCNDVATSVHPHPPLGAWLPWPQIRLECPFPALFHHPHPQMVGLFGLQNFP